MFGLFGKKKISPLEMSQGLFLLLDDADVGSTPKDTNDVALLSLEEKRLLFLYIVTKFLDRHELKTVKAHLFSQFIQSRGATRGDEEFLMKMLELHESLEKISASFNAIWSKGPSQPQRANFFLREFDIIQTTLFLGWYMAHSKALNEGALEPMLEKFEVSE